MAKYKAGDRITHKGYSGYVVKITGCDSESYEIVFEEHPSVKGINYSFPLAFLDDSEIFIKLNGNTCKQCKSQAVYTSSVSKYNTVSVCNDCNTEWHTPHAEKEKHKCYCEWSNLYANGCKCGGI